MKEGKFIFNILILLALLFINEAFCSGKTSNKEEVSNEEEITEVHSPVKRKKSKSSDLANQSMEQPIDTNKEKNKKAFCCSNDDQLSNDELEKKYNESNRRFFIRINGWLPKISIGFKVAAFLSTATSGLLSVAIPNIDDTEIKNNMGWASFGFAASAFVIKGFDEYIQKEVKAQLTNQVKEANNEKNTVTKLTRADQNEIQTELKSIGKDIGKEEKKNELQFVRKEEKKTSKKISMSPRLVTLRDQIKENITNADKWLARTNKKESEYLEDLKYAKTQIKLLWDILTTQKAVATALMPVNKYSGVEEITNTHISHFLLGTTSKNINNVLIEALEEYEKANGKIAKSKV